MERKALLKFKEHLKDPSDRLSSWVGEDYCRWMGIGCSNRTGNVVQLDLKNYDCYMESRSDAEAYISSCLGGEISTSLLDLKYLKYLDLSMNNFQGIPIPGFLGSLEKLRYLNLSYASFGEMIPPHLGNLSSLHYLDLYSDPFFSQSLKTIWVRDFNWLSSLSSLEYLNLGFVNLSSARTDWLEALNMLPFLSELHLQGCNLQHLPVSLQSLNFTSLSVIDLSYNHFNSSLPQWLNNISTLVELNLGNCHMKGPIFNIAWRNLCNVRTLALNGNEISGEISELVEGLSPCNNGSIQEGLAKLQEFSISSSNTTFVFNVSSEWVPPFSLATIEIRNCRLGPKFPIWLRTQKQLSNIILTGVAISDPIPSWLWKMSPQIQWLDLSNNQIGGILPSSLEFSPGTWIDLSMNRLEGPLPLWPNVWYLILWNNLLSGPIPKNIGQVMASLQYFLLSGNFLNGSIPLSVGKMKNLNRLDLSDNDLSGRIHDNWRDLQELQNIDLSRNNLSGNIPRSMCSLPSLSVLKLGDNSLSGELSPSLKNSISLTLIDIGENRFTGNVPKWIGESLPLLSELRMRDNMFTGNIPEQLCSLSHLHVLDLALNNLSGTIPPCLGNLSDLSSSTSYSPQIPPGHYFYTPELDLFLKGRQMQYTSTLELVNVIDLSSNSLWGEIPEDITKLSTLGTLNLSRNELTGKIPETIAGLKKLETLDLSCNHLSGPIPPSMSSITTLNHLNLSHNNLCGPIPSTNQFLTFNDPAIYEGNPGLCGGPLSTKCLTPNGGDGEGQGQPKDNDNDDENEDEFEMLWLWVSVALGFVSGFWAVCGSLVIKKSWRHAYFRFLDGVKDWLFVVVALNVARLRRMMGSHKSPAPA
ncbi:unnamed protein product [Ilex paraguariensis]|uniref:Leucine-rich repeat-containing N-terminal plant-type domain-containing protein n=1 Tax=Ilex paraguariensis TaxID=185542 RepID=A0ABC8R327_9AQUA